MRDIQLEHKEWAARNFPMQPPMVPAAGMVEEAGELMHCILKLRQLELWTTSERYERKALQLKLEDCIGDCAIYCISYCNAAGIDFASVLTSERLPARQAELVRTAAILVQRACNVVIQGFALNADLVMYMCILGSIADAVSVDLEQCIRKTWSQVKERNR